MGPGRKYRVRWSHSASLDLNGIVGYVSARQPQQARAIFQKIKASAKNLEFHPARGRIVPELREYSITGYQELICRPWRIIYRIAVRDVFVMAVIDGRRNVEDILLDRFLNEVGGQNF